MNKDFEYYKWGLFYFNPNDKRVIVPKMISKFSYTLNFAQPVSYVIIIAFFALMALVTM